MKNNYEEYINNLFFAIAIINTSIGLSNNDKNIKSVEMQKNINEKLEIINSKLDKLLEILGDNEYE